jgi:hypothetical protein
MPHTSLASHALGRRCPLFLVGDSVGLDKPNQPLNPMRPDHHQRWIISLVDRSCGRRIDSVSHLEDLSKACGNELPIEPNPIPIHFRSCRQLPSERALVEITPLMAYIGVVSQW